MASLPGFRFDITGASGSQGLLGPKNGWRGYVLPRGAYAAQDSTGTLITFDSASVASRFAVNNWVQAGLSTANIRQVGAVGGNSVSISGANLTVTTNDRIYLFGNTEPTVSGGSATYTTPNTTIYKRDDDTSTVYTNSMITSNSDGLIQGFGAASFYDVLIQDGNQSNQGSVIDLEIGTVQGVSVTDWAVFGSTVTFNAAIGVTGTALFGATSTFLAGTSFSGRAIFGQTVTVVDLGGVRYADAFPGANAGAKIANAIADLPSTGGVVDARGLAGAQIFTSNPFGSAPQGTLVLLGAGTYTTTAQIVVPDRTRVVGISKRQTILQADPAFAVGTPLVRLGPGGTGRLFDMRLEHLYVHCGSLANSTGVYSTQVNEGSGLVDCIVAKYRSYGINVESSGGDLPGRLILSDVEITGDALGSTAGVRLQTVDVGSHFSAITVNTDSVAGPGATAFDLNSCKVDMSDIHIEKHTNGIMFGVGAHGTASIVSGLAGVTNLISIAIGCQGGISLFGINPNGAVNAISDRVTGRTITTSSVIGCYLLGADGVSSAKSVFSSSNLADGYALFPSAISYAAFQTFVNGDTQPSVATGNWYKASNSSGTTITNFTNGRNGQPVTIEFANANTVIAHGGSIFNRSGANITPGATTTRSYVQDGSTWFETS